MNGLQAASLACLVLVQALPACARVSEDGLPLLDASGEPDAMDAPDLGDTVTDTVPDVPSETDASLDAPDVLDAPDTPDALDAVDALDATDVSDAADAADAVELCGDTVCAPGESCCSSTCTDTLTDFAHCGSCTTPCDSARASECVGGMCRCDGASPCTGSSYIKCCTPDGCVATDFNDSHCDDCYRRCSGGTTCSFGICR